MKRTKKSKRISTLGSRLTSFVSVCLVLVLLSASALTVIASLRLQADIKRNIGVVVDMERDCPATAVNHLKQYLHSCPAIESYRFTSAEDILAKESEIMGEDIFALAEGNPYTSEFELHMRPAYACVDSIEALRSTLLGFAGVADVSSETAVLQGLDTTMKRIGLTLSILAAIVLLVSAGLINNTVSLSIYSRRFIIYTMKLVGATPSYICRPFVLAGLRDGFIAGAVDAILLGAAWRWALDTELNPELIFTVKDIVLTGLGALAAGVALYTLTAWLAARRYIRANYDQMFIK